MMPVQSDLTDYPGNGSNLRALAEAFDNSCHEFHCDDGKTFFNSPPDKDNAHIKERCNNDMIFKNVLSVRQEELIKVRNKKLNLKNQQTSTMLVDQSSVLNRNYGAEAIGRQTGKAIVNTLSTALKLHVKLGDELRNILQ